jgi:glutamate 5-kinase
VRTVIMRGQNPAAISQILAGELIGTQFVPHPEPINARKHWIAHTLVPAGALSIDAGAVRAIVDQGKSLLAAGILQIRGEFEGQDPVRLCDGAGQEIARGLVNYSSAELEQIRGHRSEEIPAILGYAGAETVIHRDNLVVL